MAAKTGEWPQVSPASLCRRDKLNWTTELWPPGSRLGRLAAHLSLSAAAAATVMTVTTTGEEG